MAKLSLLDIVQKILASIEGDEVNSISDTTESLAIAGFVEESYREIVSGLNLPETFTLFELQPSNDINKPTLMYLPETIQNLIWMKYDKRLEDDFPPNFQEVKFLNLETFAQNMYNLGNDKTIPAPSDIGTYEHETGHGSVTIFYRNDRAPKNFTTFDDHTLIFDSYDSSMSNTLVGN